MDLTFFFQALTSLFGNVFFEKTQILDAISPVFSVIFS